MKTMKRLFAEEEGQGLVEYVMIIGVVVAIGLAVSGTGLGNAIQTKLSALINTAMD